MATVFKKLNLDESRLIFSPTLILSVILISFELKWSNNTRWSLFLLYLMFIVHAKRRRKSHITWISAFYFFISMLSSFVLFNNQPARAMQFLSYGYDQAFHFTLFRGFISTSWYPNVDLDGWFTNFELFTNGPLGYYSLSSFILHPFSLMNSDPEFLLTLYASFQIFTIFLLMWLTFNFITDFIHVKGIEKIYGAILTLLIIFCLPSTLLFNGFPPYFMSIILILIWLKYDSRNLNSWQRNLTLSSCIYAVSMVTPAPAAFLFLGALLSTLREFQHLLRGEQIASSLKNISPFIFVGGIVFWSFSKSSAGLGWRQLLQSGGLQNINVFTSLAIFIATSILLTRNFKNSISEDFSVIVISGMLSVFALSLLTVLFTGNLQYYAIKQIYLALFFSSIYFVISVKSYKHRSILYVFLVGLLMIPILNPIFYKSGFMGVPPRVLINTIQEESWSTAPVNSLKLMSVDGLSKIDEEICYVWRSKNPFTDMDLNSRWLNAMKEKNLISENCFYGYWNNVQFTNKDLHLKLSKIMEEFVILTELPLPEENEENVTYKIISG